MAGTTLAFSILARDNASTTIGRIGQRFGALHLGVGKVVKGLGVLAPVLGGLAIGAGIKEFIDDARESAKVGRLTAAVIKSTGGAARITTDQVGALATAISNKTGTDDEAIQSGENLLLTFTNIKNGVGKGNDIFNQASQAVTDLTAAMNDGQVTTEGMHASSIQLGKALNDPIKGVTALQKVGVSFTQSQKDQIKTLVESGNVMGAQKIILGEMSKEFGGAAAAGSDPLTKLKVIVGNLSEQVGGYLLPVVDRFATFLGATAIPFVSRLADVFAAKAAPRIKEFGGILQANVLPVLRRFGGFIRDDILPALQRFGGFVKDQFTGNIVPAVKNLVAVFGPLVTEVGSKLAGAFSTLGPKVLALGKVIASDIGPALKGFTGFLRDNAGVVRAVAAGVGAIVAAMLLYKGTLGVISGVTKAYTAVQAALNVVISLNPIAVVALALVGLAAGLIYAYKHSEKFRAVVDGAFKAVKKIVADVVDFFKDLPGAISGAVGDVKSTLTQKGKDVIGGLLVGFRKISEVATWLGKLPGRVLIWIGKSELWLIKKGANLIGGLLSGIGGKIADVAHWLGGLGLGVLRWVGSTELWLIGKGKNAIGGFLSGLGEKWRDVTGWIQKRRDSVLAWIGNTLGWLKDKGKQVLSGFWTGMVEKWKEVTKWIGGIAQWIKDHKGPVSLDAKLLIPAGRALMGGFLKGLQSGAGAAWDFVTSIGGKSRKALESVYSFASGAVPAGRAGNVALGQRLAASLYGWTGSQWTTLYNLWMGESGWNNLADNPNSTAFGIPQFLAGTARQYGVYGVTDPAQQIAAGLRYISDVYGSPIQAWGKWMGRSPHWYKQGTPWVPNDQLAYLHRGEAVLPVDVNRARLQGGQQVIVLRIDAGPGDYSRFLAGELKKYIHVVAGGDVQKALGR